MGCRHKPGARLARLFYFFALAVSVFARSYMKSLNPALLSALLLTACGSKSGPEASGDKTNAQSSAGNPLTAPVDYLGAVVKARKDADTTIAKIDTASLNQAITMFNAEKGRFPKDLNELVQGQYIPRVPTPPQGMQLSYDPQSGKVSVVKKAP